MTSNQFLSGSVSTDGTGTYQSAIMPTIGFGGMVLTTGAWPVGAGIRFRVIIQWFADPAGAIELASKQFVSACVTTGAGGVALPHAGDYVRVTVIRNVAAAVSFNISAEHRPNPLQFWIPQQASPESFRLPWTIQSQNISVGAGATTTVQSFNAAYEGPGVLLVHGPAAAAANDWVVTVFGEDEAGSFRFALATAQGLPTFQPSWATVPFIIPPAYITLDLTNNQAAAKTITVCVTPDWSRAAA